MRLNIFLLFLSIIINSCTKTSVIIEESELIGEWRSENTCINDIPASLFLNGNEFYSSILGLREENFYRLNYNSGEWILIDDKLALSNQGKFTITSCTNSIFTIKSEILAAQLYWNPERIPNGEAIAFGEDL